MCFVWTVMAPPLGGWLAIVAKLHALLCFQVVILVLGGAFASVRKERQKPGTRKIYDFIADCCTEYGISDQGRLHGYAQMLRPFERLQKGGRHNGFSIIAVCRAQTA